MAGWSEGGWKNGRRRGVAGKSVWQGGMEEASENGKESPHSVHANGLIDNSVMSFVLILCVYPFWMSFSTYRSWNHTQKTLNQYWNNGEIISRLYPLMVPYYSMKIFHKFFWSRAIGPGHHGVSLKAKLMRRKIHYDVLPERYLYLWYCL